MIYVFRGGTVADYNSVGILGVNARQAEGALAVGSRTFF